MTLDGFVIQPVERHARLAAIPSGADAEWRLGGGRNEVVIIGHRTFEQVCAGKHDWPYVGMSTVVRGSTSVSNQVPEYLREEKIELAALSPERLLIELGGRGIQQVVIDGVQASQEFLEWGGADVVALTHFPVLIGEGFPLFGVLQRNVRLVHLRTESFSAGVVQSRYAVKQ